MHLHNVSAASGNNTYRRRCVLGRTLLKYRLITALILIPIVIAALFLPPLAFALVTLVVCMLAAGSGANWPVLPLRSQRIWLAILCGFLLALMMLSVPRTINPCRR